MTDTETKKGPKTVGAAKLTVEILRELSKRKGALGVTLLARNINRYPGTVYSVLKTLQTEGLINFNPANKTYSLSYGGLLEIVGQQQPDDLLLRIEPEMKIEANRLGTCLYLSQHIRSGSMLVVCRATPDQPVAIFTRVGARFPTRVGGAGRLHAGWQSMDHDHLAIEYEQMKWVRKKPDLPTWINQVKRDIKQGFAYEENSLPEGLASVAAPVAIPEKDKKIKYMINAIGPRGNFAHDGLLTHVDALKSLASFAENMLKR